MRTFTFLAVCVAILLIAIGCSKTAPATSALSTTELAKMYEPSSLVEVRQINDFPDDLKSVLSNYNIDVAKSHTRPGIFMVGGLSKTAALIEYEDLGYVPSYHAAVYVRAGAQWHRLWDWPISPVYTLRDLITVTRSLPP